MNSDTLRGIGEWVERHNLLTCWVVNNKVSGKNEVYYLTKNLDVEIWDVLLDLSVTCFNIHCISQNYKISFTILTKKLDFKFSDILLDLFVCQWLVLTYVVFSQNYTWNWKFCNVLLCRKVNIQMYECRFRAVKVAFSFKTFWVNCLNVFLLAELYLGWKRQKWRHPCVGSGKNIRF